MKSDHYCRSHLCLAMNKGLRNLTNLKRRPFTKFLLNFKFRSGSQKDYRHHLLIWGRESETSGQTYESSTQNSIVKTPIVEEFDPFKVPEYTKKNLWALVPQLE